MRKAHRSSSGRARLKEPLPGITGPLQFAKDGNRVGSSYMAFEIQADGSYRVAYSQ